MIALSPHALAALGLVAGLWLAFALWATLGARRRVAEAEAAAEDARRAAALIDASPAMPLLIEPGGALQGSGRLAGALGIAELPGEWDALLRSDCLSPADAEALREDVARAAASGGRFERALRPAGSTRVLRIDAMPAPAPAAPGAMLLWFFDETESEEQAAALRARLERHGAALDALSALIEAAPFPMWHRGPDLRLAMVNSAYVAAVEAEDAGEVVREGIELVDEAEGPEREAAAVRAQGELAQRTVPATIAGERRTMQIVEVPLGPGGVAGYAIDVEDQEQARAELARFVRAQRDMLDRLSAGVAQFGRDRSLIFFNQPFARLFSLSADLLGDRPEFDRVIEAMREQGNLPEVRDFPDWKEERRRWFTSGLAADEEDWLLPSGKHLRVVAQPLPDGGLLVIFEDRTEQIRLASARDTLLRVRTATFDNLFEAIGVFASDGRLHLWNNRFRELWEFEEEQLAKHPRVDSLTGHLARKLRNPNHAGLVRELVRSATIERKQRSGRVSLTDGREFEFAAVPLPDGNALFTMLDITASKTVEAALRERNEALEDADRLKTAFVSNMSYELRTPLTSIGGFAEMLEGGYAGDLPPTAAEYVAAILDSVARLSALIDNVLDLTQSDVGSLLLAEEEIDLAELCRETGESFRAQAEEKEIDFAIELTEQAGRVTGDRSRLRQSLGNVLRNALAFTDPGGRVLLHADGSAGEAAVTVSDNGRGIAPEDQARVFDRFHRTADAGAGDAQLGLGLPLARQFVEAHGGTIDLQSEPGQGTTVTIRLPRREAARQTSAAA
ncbi:MAG: ATP-binding protein [Allosphingosinicella sp.]|uniref:PAS domain-containing sensor histidine kinase n=1 Tax=Allosphingosinicella sp. TaxID=2823234 RepID=UPI00394BFD98